MGLFTNNIAPIVSADINWNKIGYAAWVKVINDNHSSGFNNRFWWSIGSDVNGYQPEPVFHNSNELKNYIRKGKFKKIKPEFLKAIDDAITSVYSDYGVWIKYKIQMNRDNRIKSIYFYRFC